MRRRKGSIILQEAKHFSTVLLDPPWPERGGGKIKRGADRHYSLLPVSEIAPTILNSGAWCPAVNAHMYMWTTSNYIMKANTVIEALGFRYVACVPWVKTGKKVGLGQYFRGKAEYLLFAVKGKGFEVRTEDRYVIGLIEAARREHSRKPEEAYELIEKRSKGPFMEFFGRGEARLGWSVWGNEAISDTVPQATPGAIHATQTRDDDPR